MVQLDGTPYREDSSSMSRRDLFAGPEGRSIRSLRRGQGKILALKGEQVAAWRDDGGKVTLLEVLSGPAESPLEKQPQNA